jgi:hypothetical protein
LGANTRVEPMDTVDSGDAGDTVDSGDAGDTVDSGDAAPAGVPFGLVAVGLVVGLVVGVVAAWALGGSDDGVAAPQVTVAPVREVLEESPEAAEQFLVAWERSRRATYVAVTEWHRITDVGAELRQMRVVVQRPPDRIRRAGGSVSGVADGVRYTCDEVVDPSLGSGSPDENVVCQAIADPSAHESFDAQVSHDVELMWRHLEGTSPLYRVGIDDDGCFHLRLARTMLAPPYGARSMFCFDEGSGAVERFRIERAEGTDTEELRWVDTEVTDADVVSVVDGSFDRASR